MKIRVLIVEDQFVEANNLRRIVQNAGYQACEIAQTVQDALLIADREHPDIALLDIRLQGPLTGIDLAHLLRSRNIAFVYLSANSDKETVALAKASRPYGFLVKPLRERDVLVMLDVALYLHRAYQENLRASNPPPGVPSFPFILGKSLGFQEVLEQVKLVCMSETSVLILGESGTGKELIARAIHENSNRRKKPMVVVNCGALPPNLVESELFGHMKGVFTGAIETRTGKFEEADGGTVFLDEIGELALDLQVKFLRVLQEHEIEPIGGKKRKIDVRIIAATNRNLDEEMAAGRFRMDLYYRLNVFPLNLPPLRERKEDIGILAEHFVQLYADKQHKTIEGLSEQAIAALEQYPWPGNIRELQNLMERAVLLAKGKIISSVPLPNLPAPAQKLSFGVGGKLKTIAENERDHILLALEKCEWKIFGKNGAAKMLEINGSTLQSRMRKLGIEKRFDHCN